MSNRQIECIKFRHVGKGSLVGYADLYVPAFGLEIYGCQVFCKDGRKWMTFPSKETGVDENGKKKYWPHVRFRSRESMDNFSSSAMIAIDEEISKIQPLPERQSDPWPEIGNLLF